MPDYNINAIVLKRISLGESDRIVTLLSREKGKLSGVAKGSRKPMSKFAGATEVITYAKYQLATGMNLDVMKQTEIKESFPRIHLDLMKISYASYLAEVTERFTEEDELCPNIFDLLLSSLYMMENTTEPEIIARMFDLRFMKEIGYEPALDRCLRCDAELDMENSAFSPSSGGMICRNCGYLPDDSIILSPAAVEAMIDLLNADPIRICELVIDEKTMDQIARAMRWYIRYRTERELKSMQFLQILKLGRCDEKSINNGNL